ncbi:DUF309 domain-containing protein [Paenibacillus sp. y28]|uniref:DUF309 domain-containing protein n=1 Tax=Paenibacillus sp. y28 TaxID=3129110 RepID=UPI0030181D8B
MGPGNPSGAPAGGYASLYVAFVYYFNEARDYFECHEVLEELWLEEGRPPLLQGLLQVAVGLYHDQNGNRGGALKLMKLALEKLDPYPAAVLGIDLGRLREEAGGYLKKLISADEQPFECYDLTLDVTDPDLAAAVTAFGQEAGRRADG